MDAPLAILDSAAVAASEPVVDLDGVCSIAGGPDVACRVVAVSWQSMTVEVAASAAFADAVTLQLPQIGIVEAAVAEVRERGFRLHFEAAPDSKLGLYVAWLGREEVPSDGFGRGPRHERLVPLKRLVTLRRRGVPASMARIVDLSRSGAAITCGKPPELDERVMLGAFSGLVVRLIDGGVAIQFDHLVDEQDFGVLIDLDAPSSVSVLEAIADPRSTP